MKDMLQEEKKLNKPGIRVWCHPTSGGDDFYYTFKTVKEAELFIKYNSFRPEEKPLVAYDGFEMYVKDFKKKYKKVKIK